MVRPEVGVEDGHQLIPQEGRSGHPLVVAPTRMVVRPIQAAAGEVGHEPREDRLVIGMHPKRDLRLPPVATEVTLAHEQADKESGVERRKGLELGG